MSVRGVSSLAIGVALMGTGLLLWQARPVAGQPENPVFVTAAGPVTVLPGQSVRGCANNLFGTGVAAIRVTFIDGITGEVIGTPHELRVAPGQGACFTNPSNDKIDPQTLMVVFSVPASSADARGNDKKSLAVSVQLVDPETRFTTFIPSDQYRGISFDDPLNR